MSRTAPASEIAVIIVNYGTADLTIAGVQSVLARTHGGRVVDVHVLDNASPDDDAARLAAAHAQHGWGDRVTLYPEAENHGFGRGNNVVLRALAAREAPPRYVFLLNPDAALDNEALDILAQALETDPRAGFAGASICKPGGVPVVAAFRFHNMINTFSEALHFGPVARMLRRWNVALPPDTAAGRVDWVSGAAVMMRMDCLTEVGFFDPDFFLYFEETEIMHRAGRKGWHTLYVPAARVIHAEGAATGVASGQPERRRRPAYWYRSWRLYALKTGGRAQAILAAIAWIKGAAGDHVIARLRGRPPHAPLHFFDDFWAAGLRPLLGGKDPGDGR